MISINRDTDILLAVLRQYLNEDKYDLSAFISLLQEQDVERHLKTVEDMMLQSIAKGKTRGILRCSQGEYVAIKNVHSISFSWSLELAADIRDESIQADIYTLIDAVKGQKKQVELGEATYDVVITCTQPVAFSAQTISGTDYLQVVLGGKCSITDRSELADNTTIKIDNVAVDGLINISTGYTLIGENYTTSSYAKQITVQHAYSNALSLQIHCLKDDPIAKVFRRLSTNGGENLSQGQLKTFLIEIDYHDGEAPISQNFALNQASCAGSLGSFVLLDLQFVSI